MSAVARLWRSTVGKKAVMAVTGLIWVAFLLLHMLGNLQAFMGPAKLNGYAAMLHGPLEEVVWLQRVVLFLAVVLHVIAAVQLTRQKQAARPVGYAKNTPQASTFASRTIRWGGALILLFLVLHILHFTTRSLNPPGLYRDAPIYSDVVASFGIWWVALFYVIAMVAIGLHLYHGAWSSFRSLGVAKAGENPLKRRFALALAALLALGFMAVPIAVLVGLIR